ncbi:MAG: transglutaminase-like domain-containing protein [Thermoactinomyces sp.]
MSWKWFSTGCALLTACLLGIAVSQENGSLEKIYGQNPERGIANLKTDATDAREIRLEDYAHKLEAKLEKPRLEPVRTDVVLSLAGTVGKTGNLAVPYIWVQIEYQEKQKRDLPTTMDVYVPVTDGYFEKQIRLFQGRGEYRVILRLPDREKEDYFYQMTSFTVYNASDSLTRDISYSMAGQEAELKLASPKTGYIQAQQGVWVEGEVKNSVQNVLLQISKGKKSWKREIRVRDGRFREQVPLLFGKGTHRLDVMVPDRDRWGFYREGAELYIEQTEKIEREPIVYSKIYAQRGIHLTRPAASGDTAGLSYRISGQIDPSAPYAKQTSHMIVRIEKDQNKATYFLPVKNYRFDDRIWLRFGAGKYDVTLYVPEITSQNRDYFRFFTVASFKVESTANKDLRYLLPSRGIESDHHELQRLSRQITRHASTPREKARAIYRYVATTMTYDMEKFRNNEFHWSDSALKSLRTKKGVCQDYVFLTIALLRAADLPSRFVEGEAGGQQHAWVEVQVDGRWLVMDPTWGSGYITKKGTFKKKLDFRYFDPSQAFLDKTHRRTGFTY